MILSTAVVALLTGVTVYRLTVEKHNDVGVLLNGAGFAQVALPLCFQLGQFQLRASLLQVCAGGAVRGILEPLIAAIPASIVIANRTTEKAQTLVQLFEEYAQSESVELSAQDFESLSGHFDIIIKINEFSTRRTHFPAINCEIGTFRCFGSEFDFITLFLIRSKVNGLSVFSLLCLFFSLDSLLPLFSCSLY